VAFFLAGLVVLGGLQQWWLQPLLMGMSPPRCSSAPPRLTASPTTPRSPTWARWCPGVSDEFKYAIVAGAVTGGGLTVIANAPNPAGVAILPPPWRRWPSSCCEQAQRAGRCPSRPPASGGIDPPQAAMPSRAVRLNRHLAIRSV
jgi:hypothetical protein